MAIVVADMESVADNDTDKNIQHNNGEKRVENDVKGDTCKTAHVKKTKIVRNQETLRHIAFKDKTLKMRGSMPPTSRIDVQVLGTGTWPGLPRSIYVDLDYFGYIFNCGEGTQRVATEHKMRIAKLSNIFLTRYSWDNVGGLNGMALTLDNQNVPKITIHGPPGMRNLTNISTYTTENNMHMKIAYEDVSKGSYVDSSMSVDYVTLFPREKPSCSAHEPESKRQKFSPTSMSVVYICKQRTAARRNIDLARCNDLGIPKAEHKYFGKLVSGQSIVLQDGRTITPEQVLKPESSKSKFIVVDVPDATYLFDLDESIALGSHYENTSLIIHFTPAHIMHSELYQKWMKNFSASTDHLVLNEQSYPIPFSSQYIMQDKLNLVDDKIFPSLFKPEPCPVANGSKIMQAKTGMSYQLIGGRTRLKGFHFDECINLDSNRVTDVMEMYGVRDVLQKTRSDITAHRNAHSGGREYPEVLFLGTGSAIPNKIRNVSAILVFTRPDDAMLLDCGEGTLGQMSLHYGPEKIKAVLRALKAIFISHMHADHLIGIAGVLQARCNAFDTSNGEECPMLELLAPDAISRQLIPFLEEICQMDFKIRHTSTQDLAKDRRSEIQETYDSITEGLSLKELEMVKVHHRQCPYAIVITHKDGYKLTYSGDTTPCDALIEAGQGSDILIHEASLEDGMEEDAALKRHSTTSQAIDVGVKMNAKYTILTHFSQRYAKIPLLPPRDELSVGIAFDHMSIRHCDLPVLSLVIPALKVMFAEEIKEVQTKAEKRKLKEIAQKEMEANEKLATSSCDKDSMSEPGTAKHKKGEK